MEESPVDQSKGLIKPPEILPDGFFHPDQFNNTKYACRRLSDEFLKTFSENPFFMKAHPVLLGSLSRGELCPKSDLDLGFFGSESEVRLFVEAAQKSGLKIRSRILTLEAIREWPLLEQLSLLEAKALTPWGEEKLKEWPGIAPKDFRKVIGQMSLDRERRMKTFSIENVLEPHLKTGGGGLRDLLHFQQVLLLRPEIEVDQRVLNVMEHCRWFLLTLRFKLHLLGGQDYLQADLQIELARWLGYPDFRALMKQVQLCLSRALFYSEWIQQWALLSKAKRKILLESKFTEPLQIKKYLEKNPDILSMYQVRKDMDQVITEKWIKSNPGQIQNWMNSVFSWKSSEKVLRAFFRSRLADLLDPRLRMIVGYNQHDQYHAFTADAHILNLLIEFKTVIQKPSKAGGFKKIISELKEIDRSLLAWTCYYHDLGKGSAGAHEEIGREYVHKDSKRFHRLKAWTEEVEWLVENHLEFSKAAFRGDPNDDQTLVRLHDLKLNPARIRRLMVFTFLDICATHPKAWTPWKERLLLDLYQKLMDPERTLELERKLELKKLYPQFEWTAGFLNSVPFGCLKKDLAKVTQKKQNVSRFEFYPTQDFFWVRYFNPDNQKGILLKALQSLFALGCSVQQAYIFSLDIGVYDWFLVESPQSLESLKKRLPHLSETEPKTKMPAKWNQVSMLSVTDKSWTLLLQGRDARGLLMNTIEQMVSLGAEIQAAKAQTWGRQVEDVIEMHPVAAKGADEWLSELSKKLT